MKTVEKRKLNKHGIDVSLLGFGCMRFPTTSDGKINEDEAFKMMDYAYQHGVNYFDTAYVYHGGESEHITGKFLKRYPRESFYVATKLPCWSVSSIDDAMRILDEQRKNLDVECIDFYLLHALNRRSWEKMCALGIIDYLAREKDKGKIKYLGFSFHDDYDVFEEIINSRDWDFCQIQLNYTDQFEQAGVRGYELAKSKNIPVIVMEPVKGGSLATLPDELMTDLKSIKPDNTTASWAMRWVGSLSGVKVILSGMSTMEQVSDNVKTFTDFESITENENKKIDELITKINSRVKNSCTHCNYCMPCPVGVDIPWNFEVWNKYGMFENKGELSWQWKNEMPYDKKAHNCIECGQCENACPQKIHIRDDLKTLESEIKNILS